MRFVDSHLHLGKDGASALSFCQESKTLLVTCGTDRRTSEEALDFARLNSRWVKVFVGVHPSEAAKSRGLRWLKETLARASGLGEVGLDPAYSSAGRRGAQMKVLAAQLEEAQKQGKPVQVHSRSAEKEVLEVLGAFRLRSVLMHWLQSEEALPETLLRGYFVSFGPALLYSKKLQRIATKCALGQVLTETDSPVAYGPLGGVHGPFLVPSVVFKLAEVWGIRFEDAREVLAANAIRFLGVTEKG